MNTREDPTDLPADLRLQLRRLRADAPPGRDLWPGIARGIEALPRRNAPAPGRRPRPLSWFAMAAVLVLAVGMGWQLRPDGADAPAPQPAATPSPPGNGVLLAQADAMAREYEAALREVEAARGIDAPTPVLAELDAAAATLHAALSQAPDSRFLFDRLQRVYAQRLAVTQRHAHA